MSFADYAAFWPSLTWLAALMLAALLPSLPASPWRRHAGWLVGFCAGALLVEAQHFVGVINLPGWRPLGAVASGLLLWEFARRTRNEGAVKRISALTHCIALEAIAVMAAILVASNGGPPPDWFAAAEMLFAALPLLIGALSAALLWQGAGSRDRRMTVALRTALIGVATYGLGASSLLPIGANILPPLLLVLGLGFVCLTNAAARTPAALACAGGLLVTAMVGPLIVAGNLGQRDDRQRMDLLTRGERAAAPLQGRTAARLAARSLPPETTRSIAQHLERITASDPLLRSALIWQSHEDRVAVLTLFGATAGKFIEERGATPQEKDAVRALRPFVDAGPSVGATSLVVVHVPLTPAVFETPAAWLSLSYPDVFWEVQREHARRTGVVLIGVFSGFCAMGFVLAARQAIDSAQHLAIERAQSADKAKTEFLAFLSHEMRTPLQTILGRTELLQADKTAPASAHLHGAAIQTQGRLLHRLVTDLLDLGTLEAGKFQLRPHPFSLRLALAAVEDTIRSPAAAKQLALEISVTPDVPDHLIGDETRLRQVLSNIFGNAVKYTSSGGVTLRVTRGDRGPEAGAGGQATGDGSASLSPATCPLVFTVTDTGPGVPPDKIPQLFTLFTRLDSGDTFTREGTGVGLALVRRLCEIMGGTATAANHPAGGAVFTVRIPFARDLGARAPAGDDAAAPAHAAGLRVLVAEDNAPARAFLVEALQSLGHRVDAVADGPAALAAAAARRFDAILLDINLPGTDGVTIARTLARQPLRPRLIGCSAEAFRHTRDAALAAGMDAFLEKPVSVTALAHALPPPPAAAPPPAGANLFERLRAPALMAATRATLARELPATVRDLRAAHHTGDTAALRRQAHALLSTALLADDATLARLCRQLEREADAGAEDTTFATLEELDRHAAAATS